MKLTISAGFHALRVIIFTESETFKTMLWLRSKWKKEEEKKV